MAQGLMLVDGDKKTAVLYKSIICVCQHDLTLMIYINGKADPLVLYPKTIEERDRIFKDVSDHMLYMEE